MTQHSFIPTDDGSKDGISVVREWTTPLEMKAEESNRDHMDAVRSAASSSKREAGDLPAAVDVNNTRRVFPVGPRAYGSVVEAPFHPSPTLDPRHVELMDGYEEFQADLAPLRSCLNNAFTGLANINAAREQLRQDPTVNAAAAAVKLVAEAERKQGHIYETFAKTAETLNKNVATLERSLQSPVEQKAGLGTINDSIRAHAKALKPDDRNKFMADAFASGDESTIVAIVGAPHYLSGLSKEMHAHHLRQLHEMRSPDITRRLKTLRSAADLIERAFPIALSSVEQALGTSFKKAKELKSTSDASAAALAAIMGPQE